MAQSTGERQAEPAAPATPQAAPTGRLSQRFLLFLLGITGGGLVLRLLFTYFGRRKQHLGFTDSGWYWLLGRYLAKGSGFIDPFQLAFQRRSIPSAFHPPLFSSFLAVVSWLGFDQPLDQRFATCLLGAATIFFVGLLGRSLAGDRAGLIAAGIAALYPNLWINDAALVSESLTQVLTAITLVLCYRLWRTPSWGSAAALGAVLGLGALNRAEALLLYPLIALPLVLVVRDTPLKHRLALFGAVVVAGAVVVGPWAAYNVARFDEPSPPYIATGSGTVIMFGNCPDTYEGRYLGYWAQTCGVKKWPRGDESSVDRGLRQHGLDYANAHLASQPKVIAARVGRLWQVYRPIQSIEFDRFFERRGVWPSRLALMAYFPLMLASVASLVVMYRRRVTIIPMIGLAIAATATAAVSFGITRYRAPVDVALPALAAVAIEALITRRRAARPRGAS